MKNLTEFPQTINTPRLVLRVVAPTAENATMLLNIINQNRDYFMDWQAHFGELKTVEDVIAYLISGQIKLKPIKVCVFIYTRTIISSVEFAFLISKIMDAK